METFLQSVAHDLYQKTGGNLSDVAVVFPNKRAGLFFNEYLVKEADRPIWSPAYLTISELFRKASPLEVADPIQLVCELYDVFRQQTGSRETLDDFYFWGEMLISDFDDADKNLADTDALFSNLKELNELSEHYDFLEEGQKEAISQFFRHFSLRETTELKQRFTDIWNGLGNLYTTFRHRLETQGLAYEGMLYRQVIDRPNVGAWPYRTYVFVGFNVLNKVEHRLFSRLREAGKALFYWDYDTFYLHRQPHEAGEFIRRNLRDFPSELPAGCYNHLDSAKDITYVESPTENGQSRYLTQWLRENLTPVEKETAVVLCNEALLQSTLHSLPENIRHTNITMGFPLSQTPAYSLVCVLLDLHTSGYNAHNGRFLFDYVISTLTHPYVRSLSDEAHLLQTTLTQNNRFYPLPSELQKDRLLQRIFTPVSDNLSLCRLIADTLQDMGVYYRQRTIDRRAEYDQLYRESLFQTFSKINRFADLIETGKLPVTGGTLKRLITRVLSASSIPFHGEPAIGLQVMGVLETRNLDFRHLILLSVNEGQLPKTGSDASFIPYNLRKAFGMTTIDHKIAVYAYYFYRLLQRAEKVTLVYNTATDGINRGEMSRFLLQFLVEWEHPVRRLRLEARQSPQGHTPLCIEKTDAVMKRMQTLYDLRVNPHALLSPTMLNCYLDCPLKFYFRHVAQLSAPEAISADVDAATFGSIFHDAAEHIYKDLTAHGPTIDRATLETLLKDEPRLQAYVDDGFKRLFFHIPADERPEYNGLQLINAAVILRYLKQLLRGDIRYAPFEFVASERFVSQPADIPTPKGMIHSRIGGIIDRIDRKENILRIVDYKTGGMPDTPANVAALFVPDRKRSAYVFQTFLYADIVCGQLAQRQLDYQVAPSLLFIHRCAAEDYSPVIRLGEARKAKEAVLDFLPYRQEFHQRLQTLLEEIFHPDLPFRPTDVEDPCSFCEFKAFCRKS